MKGHLHRIIHNIYISTNFINIYKGVLPVLKFTYNKSICCLEVYYIVVL